MFLGVFGCFGTFREVLGIFWGCFGMFWDNLDVLGCFRMFLDVYGRLGMFCTFVLPKNN